jgi:hypothetical protein
LPRATPGMYAIQGSEGKNGGRCPLIAYSSGKA